LAVAAAFTGGAAAGTVAGPLLRPDPPDLAPADIDPGNGNGDNDTATPPAAEPGGDDPHAGHRMPAPAGAHERDGEGEGEGQAATDGLLQSAAGHTLAPGSTVLTGAPGESFSFRILGPDGQPVTAFETRHEKQLHLVVVSRDLTLYHHLHPDLAADGTWTVAHPGLLAGAYHAVADFAPAGGPALALGVGLLVPGTAEPRPLPATGPVVEVDGYSVALDGAPVAGTPSTVTFTVTRDGAPVTDLAPHLGAHGHLVAIRAGDLAFAHVHPADGGGAGPDIPFTLDVPAPGDHRLFLDFAHGGSVHTAAFTVTVPAEEAP
jgi:hypothetical protein